MVYYLVVSVQLPEFCMVRMNHTVRVTIVTTVLLPGDYSSRIFYDDASSYR